MNFRLVTIFLLIGIIPLFVIQSVLLESTKTKMRADRMAKISTYSTDISAEILRLNYLNGEHQDIINGELIQFASLYNGRVIIVDPDFYVVKDTYGLLEDKQLVSEGVINCMNGINTSYYNSRTERIEMVMPIKSGDTLVAILSLRASTSDINTIDTAIRQTSTWLMIGLTVILIGVALLLARAFTKPFKRVTKSIDRIAEGYFDEKVHLTGYTEIEQISDAFNVMIDKLQGLESSRQEFVSNVSHELKTPITSIKVLADSLNGQEDVPVELYKEFMQDIVEEIDRENVIINDLLALVRMDKTEGDLHLSDIKINEMLELILKRLRPIAGKRNIELELECVKPVTAQCDEVKLTLAFSNLVENAIKYNVASGWVRVSLNADHKYFYVKVADSGIGIAKEFQDKIFERFYRVDKARSRETGGTGLGLAITKNIIQMHGGAIRVQSKEDEGTIFTVRLPIKHED